MAILTQTFGDALIPSLTSDGIRGFSLGFSAGFRDAPGAKPRSDQPSDLVQTHNDPSDGGASGSGSIIAQGRGSVSAGPGAHLPVNAPDGPVSFDDNYDYILHLVPSDNLFTNQWHLQNTGQSGGTAGVDANLTEVWDEFTGEGVTVGVWDDGVSYTHSDLDDNYDASLHIPDSGGTHDPYPSSVDSAHGTAVAGVIAAENNGSGTVGVAFDATIAGVDMFFDGDLSLADSMSEMDAYDITNHSWGFTSPFAANLRSVDPFWTDFFAGVADAVTNGRGGLGTIIVKSAGNGRQDGDNANAQNWNSMPEVIAVAAASHNGEVSWYSSPGASVLISGHSNGPSGSGIWTTDREGSDGYDGSDYTSSFGGTSSAAPLVSGVVALMLEANPDLGWRDVQTILAYTATHTGTAIGSGTNGFELFEWGWNGADNWNGGGLHFSNDYGFGLIDAHAAVRLAESWTDEQTSANWETVVADEWSGSQVITDNDPSGFSFDFTATDDVDLETVGLRVDIPGGYTGDYYITLTSPSGTTSVLAVNGVAGDSVTDSFVFFSNAFRGEDSVGTWTVSISDRWAGDTGTLTFSQLEFYGAAPDTDDLYIYTNEFSDYAGGGNHSTVFGDSNGGTDTLNAAAVTSNTTIDLDAGTGTIDGVAVTSSGGIENVITGDGDDSLTGDASDNVLNAGRGDDTLIGGAGSDTLIGGAGNDILNGGLGVDDLQGGDGDDWLNGDAGLGDSFDGGDGNDTASWAYSVTLTDFWDINLLTGEAVLNGSSNVETLTSIENVEGSQQADTITGDGGANSLFGQDGDDSINGGGGNDVLDGENGNDTLNGDAGDDNIQGAAGNDMAYGNTGNDILSGGANNDVLFGGDGEDSLLGGNNFDRLYGGAGNDFLDGGNNTDILEGGAGDDELHGGAGNGNDRLEGQTGNDTLDGGGGNDLLLGGDGDDELRGGGNFDRLYGGDGNDTLYGEGGIDKLYGGVGLDILYGGDDKDRLLGGQNFDRLYGGDGDDYLDGGANTDILKGDAGDDKLFGAAGNDRLEGGVGNDSLYGGLGADLLLGESGDDTLLGGGNFDRLYGGGGDDLLNGEGGVDILSGQAGNDTLFGGAGNDRLLGGNNFDRLYGEAGNDYLDGGNNTDILEGGDGDDELYGRGGNDRLEGQAGNDTLFGNNGNDLLIGGTGDDNLFGGRNFDRLYGNDGNDYLDGQGGIDLVYGGAGSDTLLGGGAGDKLVGGQGDDTLSGQSGGDNLQGGAGEDTLYGGAGDDKLYGGAGADELRGNAGADQFIFEAVSDSPVAGADTIVNFETGTDILDLSLIDANSGTGANDAFTIVGGFSSSAGELTITAVVGGFEVAGDVDGDGVADFLINLDGGSIVGGDIIL